MKFYFNIWFINIKNVIMFIEMIFWNLFGLIYLIINMGNNEVIWNKNIKKSKSEKKCRK